MGMIVPLFPFIGVILVLFSLVSDRDRQGL